MNTDKPLVFNKDAKAWKPKSQAKAEDLTTEIKCGVENIDLNIKSKIEAESDSKLQYNLNAELFIPKEDKEKVIEYVEDNEDYENVQKEINEADEKLIDELVKKEDAFDEDLSDEDNWFPKYQDCVCCKGFVYKCDGEVCKSLGVCFCKTEDDNQDDA